MGSKRNVKMRIRYTSFSTDKLTRVFGLITWRPCDRKMTISVSDHSHLLTIALELQNFGFLGEEI
jgi:hypothetical protein